MLRGRRLVVVAIGLLPIALLGAFAGIDSAAATSVTQPVAAALPSETAAAPCVSQGVPSGDAAPTRQITHHAGLAVAFPDHVKSFCIEFSGDSITVPSCSSSPGCRSCSPGSAGWDPACAGSMTSDAATQAIALPVSRRELRVLVVLRAGGRYVDLSEPGPAQHHVQDGDVDGWVWGNGHTVPGDARGPCPATPTPVPKTGALPSTPPPLAGGPSNGGQNDTPRAPAPIQSATTPEPRTAMRTAVPSSTPLPQVVAQQRGQRPDANAPTKSASGGGAPVGLIVFGVVVGVLVAGIGGLALRRRLGG